MRFLAALEVICFNLTVDDSKSDIKEMIFNKFQLPEDIIYTEVVLPVSLSLSQVKSNNSNISVETPYNISIELAIIGLRNLKILFSKNKNTNKNCHQDNILASIRTYSFCFFSISVPLPISLVVNFLLFKFSLFLSIEKDMP